MIKDIIHKVLMHRTCRKCDKHIGWLRYIYNSDSERCFYCEGCARIKFKICDGCGKSVKHLNKFQCRQLCDSCFKDKVHKCDGCGASKYKDDLLADGYSNLCIDCYNSVNRQFRRISIGQTKQSSKSFIKNYDKRYTGVEIECLNREDDMNCFIRKELKQYKFSQGIDGSLDDGGVEFDSVPMNGDLLFDSIEVFCKELNRKDYYVNKSCGLHIHLEVEQELEYLKKLYLFYLRFEDMFFNMLPKSRRSRIYCVRFNKYYKDTPEAIANVKTLSEFKEMLYETINYGSKIRHHDNRKRYCWANLHSIFYRGTLEVRSHSGTVSAAKIINWIMIHQRVLEFLHEKTLEEIATMKVTKKAFLEIFDKPLQNYIKKRWQIFIKLEENSFIAKAPVYIKTMKLNGTKIKKGDKK